MLGDITAADEIYIVTGRTDMRKSIDGLCAIVEDQLHMDPRRSALYLFCGKRCDRIKALLWESDGFVLLYKRMEVQGRFRWPRNQLEVKQLTWQQFDWLMSFWCEFFDCDPETAAQRMRKSPPFSKHIYLTDTILVLSGRKNVMNLKMGARHSL